MADNTQPSGPSEDFQADGSISDAIVAWTDDLDDGAEPSPNETVTRSERQPRNRDNGQWEQKNGKAQQPQPKSMKPTDMMAGANEPPPDDESEEESHPVDAESFFELPADKEGEPPTRIKAEAVWQGYQERDQLKQEIVELRKQVAPPEAYDAAISDSIQARGHLIRQIQHYRALLQPREPDAMMLNPKSQNYNPEEYYHQLQLSRQMQAQIAGVEQELQALANTQQAEQQAVHRAKMQRERNKVMELWPDLRDEKVASQVRDDLSRYWNIDQQTLNTIADSRFFALAKDAIAYRQGLRSKEAAVRVVKGKPKLVRGQARDQNGARQQKHASAMRRLANDGSIESAMAAMDGII